VARNDILVRIGLKGLSNFRKDLKKASYNLRRAGQNMKRNGEELSKAVTLPIVGVGAAAVMTAAKFEKLQVSLNTLTGSAREGARAFERLKELSAGTPFQLEQLVKAQNTLMGFGLSSDEAFDSVKRLGDIAAITGADMGNLAIAFGQSAAEGRVMSKDIRQFINNGVPMIKLLAEEMGVAESSIFDLASEGKITFEVLQRAFRRSTEEGGMFADGMKKQSTTIAGLFSTLKDNVSILLADIGKAIVDAGLREFIVKLTDEARRLVKAFGNLSPTTKKIILVIAGLAAALGPVLMILGQLQIAVAAFGFTLTAALGPISLIVAAIAALTAGFMYAYNNIKPFRDNMQMLGKIFKYTGGLIWDFVKNQLQGLAGGLKGITLILNGEFKKGFKVLGQTIIDHNPIASAKRAGENLAKSIVESYKAEMLQAAKDMREATDIAFEFASGALVGERQTNLEQFFTGRDVEKTKNSLTNKVKDVSETAGKTFTETFDNITTTWGPKWQNNIAKFLDIPPELFAKNLAPAMERGMEAVQKITQKAGGLFDLSPKDMTAPEISFGTPDDGMGDEEPAWYQQVREYAGKAREVLGGLFDFWGQLQYNREQKAQQQYEAELQRIENSTMSEKKKEEAIAKLNEERDKQERKLARDRAKREKAAAIFQAIINTALAVVKALSAGPKGIALAAIVGAIGAAKTAAIAAEPLPALAQGGLAFGPTTAIVGDNVNARSNPEVIAPLDKLKGMMGEGGNIRLTGSFRIDGQDLIYVLEENQQIRERR